MKDDHGQSRSRTMSGHLDEPALQVICLGAGGGPSEDNVTGFLVRSTAAKWAKNSVLAVDAGCHLAAITRIMKAEFPLVSESRSNSQKVQKRSGSGNDNADMDSPSPGTANTTLSDEESSLGTPTPEVEMTTVENGPFAGLSLPHMCARANAVHVVREHVSTYLITHPHLDHISAFAINTAAFHNTSRPKRLAALPFTVSAIKTHIFNNVIWPNLTDEDGGVGLVTFQRLQEGGNISLGEGGGKGYIEVCDGLGVRGFKVSHGHCMQGPGHVHRSSNTSIPEMLSNRRNSLHRDSNTDVNFSHPTQSSPGTPLFMSNSTDSGSVRTAAVGGGNQSSQCVIDSSAYFIRAEATSHTPAKEILIFGDVEPDSLSLSPRTTLVWAEAAPKIAAGTLSGVFIECSYTNAQADALLYGHLSPRHLLTELQDLAEMVKDAKPKIEREKEELRKGRKRKRTQNSPMVSIDGALDRVRRPNRARASLHSHSKDAAATQYQNTLADFPSISERKESGAHTPTHTGDHVSTEQSMVLADEAPLKGLKVVIIHVKDTLDDGPLVGELILKEMEEGERLLRKGGGGLGCDFEISKSGESYWF